MYETSVNQNCMLPINTHVVPKIELSKRLKHTILHTTKI